MIIIAPCDGLSPSIHTYPAATAISMVTTAQKHVLPPPSLIDQPDQLPLGTSGYMPAKERGRFRRPPSAFLDRVPSFIARFLFRLDSQPKHSLLSFPAPHLRRVPRNLANSLLNHPPLIFVTKDRANWAGLRQSSKKTSSVPSPDERVDRNRAPPKEWHVILARCPG